MGKQKNKGKSICALLLAVLVFLTGMSGNLLNVFAAKIQLMGESSARSGTCGKNLNWVISGDGTLTISGTGEMYDYDFVDITGDVTTPWADYEVKAVKIQKGVTSIGSYAFCYCSSLTVVTIPDSVTSIGESAFCGCRSLAEIIIPDSVTIIGEDAFYCCRSLTSVTIPDSVMSIEDHAFSGCSSLTEVIIPDSVTIIGWAAFSGCSSLTEVIIPDSVTIIGEDAFYGCSNLTSVTIPDSVTIIDRYAFQSCSSLAEVIIPDSVTIIRWGAFQSCSSLAEVTIPNSVTSIEDRAFCDCSSLKSVTIPNSVTSIRSYAFKDCDKLADVYYDGSEEDWKKINIDNTDDGNAALLNAMIHFRSTGTGEGGNKVEKITLSLSSQSLTLGNSIQLNAVVSPDDAENKKLSWSSDNNAVATVSENGLVTAVAPGKATITVSSTDGSNIKESCVITVAGSSEPSPSPSPSPVPSPSPSPSPTPSPSPSPAPNPDPVPDTPAVVSLYYVVQFDANGGQNLSRKKMTLSMDDSLGILPTVQRENYKFGGWYTERSGGKKVTGNTVLNSATTLYAQWAKVSVDKVTSLSLKSPKSGQAEVSYNKVSGAAGYQITYSTDKNFNSSVTKKKVVLSGSAILKGLKKGKTYYVKVRAYKIDSAGKKVYGKYSVVKKVKVK